MPKSKKYKYDKYYDKIIEMKKIINLTKKSYNL